jgi:hypothetical protein
MLSWGFIELFVLLSTSSAGVASRLELYSYFRLVSVTAQTRYGVTFTFVDLLFNIVCFSYVHVISLFQFTCNVAFLIF